MSCQTWHLKELEVEHLEVREVLRCILHTIMFHRALCLVRPKDTDSELFEITYVKCGDDELERKIEEKIDQLIFWTKKHPNKKIPICLSFYEIKNKQAKWFNNKIERVYWEHWYINLQLVKSRTMGRFHQTGQTTKLEEGSAKHAALESALHEVIFQIIRFVNEKSNHVPSVPSSQESAPFPFDITIPSSDYSFGWRADVFKRMLQTGHSNLLH